MKHVTNTASLVLRAAPPYALVVVGFGAAVCWGLCQLLAVAQASIQ